MKGKGDNAIDVKGGNVFVGCCPGGYFLHSGAVIKEGPWMYGIWEKLVLYKLSWIV